MYICRHKFKIAIVSEYIHPLDQAKLRTRAQQQSLTDSLTHVSTNIAGHKPTYSPNVSLTSSHDETSRDT